MPDERHIAQVFIFQNVHYILNMGVHVNVGIVQVNALAQAGEGGGIDLMSRSAQLRRHFLPAPAVMKHAMNKDENSHRATYLL